MTPAEAAREVAEELRAASSETEAEAVARVMLWESWDRFAELLDRVPYVEARAFGGALVGTYPEHLDPCPDGIACPLADDYPAAHFPRSPY